MDTRTLTLNDVTKLAEIVRAAQGNMHVVRLVNDRIVQGTARSIGDGDFLFADGQDVRDLYLRVTTAQGMEVAWSISDLMEDVANGTVVFE